MNTKALLYLGSLLSLTLAAPIVNAGPHRGGGNRVAPMRGGGGMARPFVGGNRIGAWNGAHWNNWNWHHHHHDHDVVFFSSFGFPFWGGWGYPWYYSYYPYGYPYGYYG